jgi:hypothetical protein
MTTSSPSPRTDAQPVTGGRMSASVFPGELHQNYRLMETQLPR